ncbi:MAG: hypothetical protein IOD12_03705 [Silvanigrellales bacterium]|jgi:hypothetical protein|nr:hypothetical protein [Silvanigrellales bacterium]
MSLRLWSVLFFLPTTAFGSGERPVGPPAGLPENLIRLSVAHFEAAARFCTNSSRFLCALYKSGRDALPAVLTMAREFAEGKGLVEFSDTARSPDLFPPGEEKPFVVQRDPVKRIVFNRGALTLPTGTGKAFPIDPGDAYTLYARALASGWTELTSVEAFRFGSTLAGQFDGRTRILEIGKAPDGVVISNPLLRPYVVALSLDGSENGITFASLFLQDSFAMWNMDDPVKKILACEGGEVLKWEAGTEFTSRRVSMEERQLRVDVRLKGRRVCANDPALLEEFEENVTLRFDEVPVANPGDGNERAFRYASGSIQRLPRESER